MVPSRRCCYSAPTRKTNSTCPGMAFRAACRGAGSIKTDGSSTGRRSSPYSGTKQASITTTSSYRFLKTPIMKKIILAAAALLTLGACHKATTNLNTESFTDIETDVINDFVNKTGLPQYDSLVTANTALNNDAQAL